MSVKDTSGLKSTPGVSTGDTSETGDTPRFKVTNRLKELQEKIKHQVIQPEKISEYVLLTCNQQKKTAYEIGEELSREP